MADILDFMKQLILLPFCPRDCLPGRNHRAPRPLRRTQWC